MTRSLTNDAATSAAATSAEPINILKVEFGGATGTLYFSDRDLGNGSGAGALNAEGRVVSWGGFTALLDEQPSAAVVQCAVELQDADDALQDLFESIELQNLEVTLYQHFADLGESDLAPLLTA